MKLLKKKWALILLTLFGLYYWSIWPATTVIPDSWIHWRLKPALPQERAEGPWEERGKYLVSVAGCAMCHTPYNWSGPIGKHAFAGGMRVRWNNALGERVTQNLTPDKDTGIGNWSEEDFIIAMKSGIYPDKRVAHWQAMPWDMHSNWSLDDMRAMYRYLMTLEPKSAPKQTPVKEPLPEDDTFYFGH